jgi:signal peptidase I
VGLAAAVALGLRAKVAESYQVLSSSMLPTLEPGDRIGGRKIAYASPGASAPHRGDIVVFQSAAVASGLGPLPPTLVKRVVGLPGDQITMPGGFLAINGWTVPTCIAGQYLYVVPDGGGAALRAWAYVEFLDDRSYLTVHTLTMPAFSGAYLVGPGEVFVLGDNRANSLDSRAYYQGQGGGVPFSAVDAQARWFLLGTHRSGETDLSRFLRPLDRLERSVRFEGINGQGLELGVENCLREQPKETHPPSPNEPRASGLAHPTPT